MDHWNGNVILMKYLSLAALEVVDLTTSSLASDANFVLIFHFSDDAWTCVSEDPIDQSALV